MTRITPCPTCPWRKTTPAKGFPGGFVNARRLVEMKTNTGEGGVMQCHCTPDTSPEICVGFALQIGAESIGYRMAVIAGLVDPDTLHCPDELHTFWSLIRTHGGRCP